MSKQASKRKRVTKAAVVPALGAAGLTFSLAGGASASTMPSADAPQKLSFSPTQSVLLGEEEIADVSLATFHLFDKENGGTGFRQMAVAAAAAAVAVVAVVAVVAAAVVAPAAARRGASAVCAETAASSDCALQSIPHWPGSPRPIHVCVRPARRSCTGFGPRECIST